MPRFSKIDNRTSVCLSANMEFIKEAKEKKLNLSLIFNEALKNILNNEGESMRIKAIETRMGSMDDYLDKNNLKEDYNDWRWNTKEAENVLEEEKRPAREDREDKGSVREI